MEFLLWADNLNAEGVGVGGFEKQFEQALIGKKNCVQHKCIKKNNKTNKTKQKILALL